MVAQCDFSDSLTCQQLSGRRRGDENDSRIIPATPPLMKTD